MQKLTNFILELADECDDVPSWLSTHLDFSPEVILDLIDENVEV